MPYTQWVLWVNTKTSLNDQWSIDVNHSEMTEWSLNSHVSRVWSVKDCDPVKFTQHGIDGSTI